MVKGRNTVHTSSWLGRLAQDATVGQSKGFENRQLRRNTDNIQSSRNEVGISLKTKGRKFQLNELARRSVDRVYDISRG